MSKGENEREKGREAREARGRVTMFGLNVNEATEPLRISNLNTNHDHMTFARNATRRVGLVTRGICVGSRPSAWQAPRAATRAPRSSSVLIYPTLASGSGLEDSLATALYTSWMQSCVLTLLTGAASAAFKCAVGQPTPSSYSLPAPVAQWLTATIGHVQAILP